jgi:hypothetical protein
MSQILLLRIDGIFQVSTQKSPVYRSSLSRIPLAVFFVCLHCCFSNTGLTHHCSSTYTTACPTVLVQVVYHVNDSDGVDVCDPKYSWSLWSRSVYLLAHDREQNHAWSWSCSWSCSWLWPAEKQINICSITYKVYCIYTYVCVFVCMFDLLILIKIMLPSKQ